MTTMTLIDLPHIFGVATGLDNMAVIAALGLATMAKDKRLWILSAFIVFEFLMPVIGYLVGGALFPELSHWGETIGLLFLGLSGLLIIGTVLFPKMFTNLLDRPLAIILLAFLLSIDNLFAGAGIKLSGGLIGLPFTMGILSAALCIIGFAIGTGVGTRLRHWHQRKTRLISGVYLSSLAVFLAVSGG